MKNYFSFSELIDTETGLENSPTDFLQIFNLKELHLVLNILRHLVGCPIKVNSAFRTPFVNKVVGGVEGSLHLNGCAADITCSRSAVLKSILVDWKKAGILSELVIHDTYFHIAL